MVIQCDTRQKMSQKHHKNKHKTWKIYCITAPNGKTYIGRTSVEKLIHRTGRNGQRYKPNKEFFHDIQEYGWDNFEKEILEECKTEQESMDLEIKYIALYDSANPEKGYNKSVGGYPCNKGRTEEDRRRIRNESFKHWKENNRKKYLESRRKIDHSEKSHARKNAWNKTPERRKHRTEYMRKYRAEHPEKIREINRRSAQNRKQMMKNEW